MEVSLMMRLFTFLILLISPLWSVDPPALKSDDIHKVMQQILKQHFDHKEVNVTILKDSFKNYIDQFDPDKIYLLNEDIRPYITMSDEEYKKILDQYRNNDFSAYDKLNETIHSAIVRSRKKRRKLAQTQQAELFSAASHPYNDQSFASTPEELQNRIKQDMISFIRAEKQRFGEAEVMKNQTQTLALYEKHMCEMECPYMKMNFSGNEKSQSEIDNYFAVHILKSLASTLDSHTEFLDPREAYEMKVRLNKEFYGVGIELENRPGGITISGLIPGSPAAKNGEIKPNDRLMIIDSQDVNEEEYEKVLDLLRGPKDSEVTLTLKRADENGKTFKVKLKRDEISVSDGRVDIATEPYGNGIIGVIALHTFYQSGEDISSFKDIREAIAKLNKEGKLRGLILDLRDNTGGFLLQAVKVAGLFISSGVIVISKYFNGEQHFFRDIDDTADYQGPLIVLTSKETASAAEIVAQALQDYGVALIAGDERTFGKGTIQSQTVTGNGGSPFFKVTVGKYYTVSGNTPQLQGVKPDVLVPSKFANEPIGEEYLDHPLPPDRVSAAYIDKLEDIAPGLKSWYLRYYTPNIQHKLTMWHRMLPVLKKNSQRRIDSNKNYQALLKEGSQNEDSIKEGKINQKDVQLKEAINIVKDMITLQSTYRSKEGNEALQNQVQTN